jgi:hypothetical protein
MRTFRKPRIREDAHDHFVAKPIDRLGRDLYTKRLRELILKGRA